MATTEQQERVNKANELYQVTCELITLCQQHYTRSCGRVRTQADPSCGKPLHLLVCFTPYTVNLLSCTIVCTVLHVGS